MIMVFEENRKGELVTGVASPPLQSRCADFPLPPLLGVACEPRIAAITHITDAKPQCGFVTALGAEFVLFANSPKNCCFSITKAPEANTQHRFTASTRPFYYCYSYYY
jgi:hypothetical protein